MAVKRWLVGCIVLLMGTLATVTLAFLVVNLSLENEGLGLGPLGKRVGLVEIVGDIESSDSVVDQLEHMRLDSSVRAVVLRLDSPGGGVALAGVYEAVRKVGTRKPASRRWEGRRLGRLLHRLRGGLHVSNPGTLTGSIGVIMSFPNTEGCSRKSACDSRS
jgi:protease-4